MAAGCLRCTDCSSPWFKYKPSLSSISVVLVLLDFDSSPNSVLCRWSPVGKGALAGQCWEIRGTRWLLIPSDFPIDDIYWISYTPHPPVSPAVLKLSLCIFQWIPVLWWFFCSQAHWSPHRFLLLPLTQTPMYAYLMEMGICPPKLVFGAWQHNLSHSVVVNVVHEFGILLTSCSDFMWEFLGRFNTILPPFPEFSVCLLCLFFYLACFNSCYCFRREPLKITSSVFPLPAHIVNTRKPVTLGRSRT